MEPNNTLSPRATRLHRLLLAIVVAVLVVFCVGALVLFVAGSSTRDISRAVAFLLLGAATILVATFIVTYATLRIVQYRHGGGDAYSGRPETADQDG